MKQSRLLLVLFFFIGSLSLSLSATVEPITVGESLWKIVSRIGVTSDIIESKLCGLEQPCGVPIHQDDIAPGGIGGGTYEITGTSKTYCLASGIGFTTGPAIAISGSAIVLDLNGFVLDGQPFGGPQPSCAILLKAGASNIVIKNGTISRTVLGICDEGDNVQLRNIVIDDVRFSQGTGAAIAFDANSVVPDVSDILIRNCLFDRTIAANIQCTSAIIRGCKLNGVGASFPSGFAISGLGTLADSILFEDCFFDDTNNFSISIANAKNGLIRRCVRSGTLTGPVSFEFLFNAVDNVVVADSVITMDTAVLTPLIQIINPENVYVARCSGLGQFTALLLVESGPRDVCGVEVDGCFAQAGNFRAFEFRATGTSAFENLVVRNCFAAQGSFSLRGDVGARFTNVVFDHCSASRGGFLLEANLGNFPAIEHVVFRDCVALESNFLFNSPGVVRDIIFEGCLAISDNDATTNPFTLNGFELGSTTTLGKVIDCYALGFTFTGFVNNAPMSANYFFGNTGVGNGVNYGGTGSLDPVLLNTGAAEIAGGTPWTNASMP